MLKIALLLFSFLILGCDGDVKQKSNTVLNEGVGANEQASIKEVILNSKNPPKAYKELQWKKLQCSEVISQRLRKKALFIAHRFEEKNMYGGEVTREVIYFIGDGKPSKIIDFDVKKGMEEFLANQSMQKLFETANTHLKQIHEALQKGDKAVVKSFIYDIQGYPRETLSSLEHAITTANTPMSIDKNYALFMNMRLFPELIEELLLVK